MISRPDGWSSLRMKEHHFIAMMRRLEFESEHRRESGAFLLGRASEARELCRRSVVDVAYYSDLDPQSLTGGITFHAAGYTALNGLCREKGLQVVADIHLHPRMGTRQSATDAAHPMVARTGHVALIAPNFGARVDTAKKLGVHVKTAAGWDSYAGRHAASIFALQPTIRGRLQRLKNGVLPRNVGGADR